MDRAKMRAIENLSDAHMDMFRRDSESFKLAKDEDEILDSWWYALVNFFDRIFYRGRNNDLSGKFERATIKALGKFLGEGDKNKLSKMLMLRDRGCLDYHKYGYTTKFAEPPGHNPALKAALDTAGNSYDREMVIDTTAVRLEAG